ncbi:hypothetical protein F5Y02DRAFT_424696 [Annulohypoxylon stygium]|nr:hypothetical protein F5Y02DRAFT_424696 [Annulohypoxylon stygium]
MVRNPYIRDKIMAAINEIKQWNRADHKDKRTLSKENALGVNEMEIFENLREPEKFYALLLEHNSISRSVPVAAVDLIRVLVADRRFDGDDWQIRDVGFFQPDLPLSYGPGESATVGKDTVWQSVYLFMDSIESAMRDDRHKEKLRQKFPQLLRGSAITTLEDTPARHHRQ